MNTLRQSIANKDATKASEDYVDANNDKQTAYNNAVAAAETIINANSNPEQAKTSWMLMSKNVMLTIKLYQQPKPF
ncbi:TPA: FIVAR domain-containing protein [Staphylococcus aureus]